MIAELVAAEKQSVESEGARATEQRIEKTNGALQRLGSEYQLPTHSVTRYAKEIFAKIPAGITLSHFSFEDGTKRILLRGHAATRSDLLQLISAMRKNSLFENVESPVENILQEQNISFSLSFSTTKED